MKSGHTVLASGASCGHCGVSLIGKIKDEYAHIKPGTEAFGQLLHDSKNFKLFGCFTCGTESPNLADLTRVTPELKCKRLLARKDELERNIPFYEAMIPKMKEELKDIEKRLKEVLNES